MVEALESIEIPAPLDDCFAGREHTDETEWIHAGEGQRGEGRIDIGGSGGGEGELHDFTAADRPACDARGDGIPVDQREGRAGVVHANPSATVRFRRKKNIAAAEAVSRRRQCGHARQLFVAVHAEGVAVSSRDKGDGTHASQSASGYVAMSAVVSRHLRQSSVGAVGRQPRRRLAAPIAKTSCHWRNNVR